MQIFNNFSLSCLLTGLVFSSSLLLEVPIALTSDLHQSNYLSDSSEISNKIFERQVIKDDEVFLIQTRSQGVEAIPQAKIVTMTQDSIVIIQDENREIIRVFNGLGGSFDLIVTAVMSEAEAAQIIESGEKIVEPIDTDN